MTINVGSVQITDGVRFVVGDSPLPQFFNGDFSQGLAGWTPVLTQIFWNGGSTLGGWPTPALPNAFPYSPDQKDWQSWPSPPSYSVTLNADKPVGSTGQSADLLMGNGTISPAGGTAYGPALVSNNSVTIVAGDTVSFAWRGISTSDAYSIYAYLVNVDTGNTVPLLRSIQSSVTSTGWATDTTVINTSGNYRYVFVAGCWDSTLGTVVGAQFRITDIKRIPQ